MKIEFSAHRPDYFKENWPGEYDHFHWFEFACGIPHSLFMISTYKENGQPNACFHSWSSFSGDGGGLFAVIPGILQHSHTFQNILGTKEFCINFLSPDYFEKCRKTINENKYEVDEFSSGDFTLESAKTIAAPRIKESFLSLECTLESERDLSGKGISSLVIGKVNALAIDESFANNLDGRYGQKGFMFNIHQPRNPLNAAGDLSAVGVIDVVKKY